MRITIYHLLFSIYQPMDSLISTFHIDWKLMVAQAVNFAVVLVVLYVFALKPLKKLMDERGKTIAGGLENAEKQKELLAEAKKVLEDGQVQLKQMAVEEKKLLKIQLEKQANESKEKTNEMTTKMIESAKIEMEAEKVRILKEAEKEVGSLMLALAEKVFGKAMDQKTQANLVEESIKNVK